MIFFFSLLVDFCEALFSTNKEEKTFQKKINEEIAQSNVCVNWLLYFHERPCPSWTIGLVSFQAEINIFTPLKANVCFGWMFLIHCHFLLFQFYYFWYCASFIVSIVFLRGCLHLKTCYLWEMVLILQYWCNRHPVGRIQRSGGHDWWDSGYYFCPSSRAHAVP